jgi:protoporphyrinogen oxidase
MIKKKIVIVGAGPAGLTAAYELAQTGNYDITVLEADNQVGGISKTVNHQGNLIDIGGHRFFSKSQKVLNWWAIFLPILDTTHHLNIGYHSETQNLDKMLRKNEEGAMLVRKRKSRIYFNKKLFDYPLKINPQLLFNLGIMKSFRIVRGIILSRIFPIKEERHLEDFFINNFGMELYQTFFKGYTEKVWGKSCTELSSEWGRQRIKSLKIRDLLKHSVRKIIVPRKSRNEKTRSLIEKFLYPAKGPGMLWEKVALSCQESGVEILFQCQLTKIHFREGMAYKVACQSTLNPDKGFELECDAVFSTMPIKNLFRSLQVQVPRKVFEIANGLEYRDFMIVGLELKKLKIDQEKGGLIKDNWLYIQEGNVKVGRLQIFNNWSPFMTSGDSVWIGAEYFCKQNDELWNLSDEKVISFALAELSLIGILDSKEYLSGKVVRCPKAYPTYTGSYHELNQVIEYLETKQNLFLMGRNGLHKYNNQDHSMLTAFKAVELFEKGETSKKEIWAINSDDEYLG